MLALAGAAWSACGQPVTSAFTYQGDLQDGGAAVEGLADLQFIFRVFKHIFSTIIATFSSM